MRIDYYHCPGETLNHKTRNHGDLELPNILQGIGLSCNGKIVDHISESHNQVKDGDPQVLPCARHGPVHGTTQSHYYRVELVITPAGEKSHEDVTSATSYHVGETLLGRGCAKNMVEKVERWEKPNEVAENRKIAW
eukprot:CAMPEP_0173454864 /NCGR_PEP_ID=MMETSP1357-20121228/53232_1 /TAXON_ID=77926 /ORGANISM="Hemiselmis rufescens, Strain PCC563" /LENGTH=135 /DNA_ID=CAMNT_0014421941 /DNA_START=231 /DNA_END=635 /DNA_ORIENTATION=-